MSIFDSLVKDTQMLGYVSFNTMHELLQICEISNILLGIEFDSNASLIFMEA